MGATALVAAAVASRAETPHAWLSVWQAEAVLGAAIGMFAIWRKESRAGQSIWNGPARKFFLDSRRRCSPRRS